MGFLKFLKRDKGKEPDLELENLDMPPAPPDFEEKGLPELPELPEVKEPISEKPAQKLKIPTPKPSPELEIPSMPEFPEPDIEPEITEQHKPMFGIQELEEEPKVEIPKPMPSVKLPKPKLEIEPYGRWERSAVREKRAIPKYKEVKGPIFIRVDRFREILTETDMIKNNLKTANQSILELDELNVIKDELFEKWCNVLMDLQKKILFIDKTFFKSAEKLKTSTSNLKKM